MRGQLGVMIGGLCFLVGAALGWASHARQFNRAQTAWVEEVRAQHVRSDMAVAQSRQLRAEADSLRSAARGHGTEAGRLEASQRQVALASRTAKEALAAARSTGDSLHAAIGIVRAVEAERDTALAAGDHWRQAYQAEFQAANRLAVRGDSLERLVARQDSLLTRGTKVVGSSGCRVPLLGVPCPVVVLGYGYTAGTDGSTVALHRGVAVTVGWKVF